jgi:hypothetical protein
MKPLALCLIALLAAGPAFADEQHVPPDAGRGRMFWSGLALGLAGVTTSVLGATVSRVSDSSTGNAPPGTYQSCVAQQRDPIYAANDCNALKAKNRSLLWGGVAVSAVGAALMIGGSRTRAEITPTSIRLSHIVRF